MMRACCRALTPSVARLNDGERALFVGAPGVRQQEAATSREQARLDEIVAEDGRQTGVSLTGRRQSAMI